MKDYENNIDRMFKNKNLTEKLSKYEVLCVDLSLCTVERNTIYTELVNMGLLAFMPEA